MEHSPKPDKHVSDLPRPNLVVAKQIHAYRGLACLRNLTAKTARNRDKHVSVLAGMYLLRGALAALGTRRHGGAPLSSSQRNPGAQGNAEKPIHAKKFEYMLVRAPSVDTAKKGFRSHFRACTSAPASYGARGGFQHSLFL